LVGRRREYTKRAARTSRSDRRGKKPEIRLGRLGLEQSTIFFQQEGKYRGKMGRKKKVRRATDELRTHIRGNKLRSGRKIQKVGGNPGLDGETKLGERRLGNRKVEMRNSPKNIWKKLQWKPLKRERPR